MHCWNSLYCMSSLRRCKQRDRSSREEWRAICSTHRSIGVRWWASPGDVLCWGGRVGPTRDVGPKKEFRMRVPAENPMPDPTPETILFFMSCPVVAAGGWYITGEELVARKGVDFVCERGIRAGHAKCLFLQRIKFLAAAGQFLCAQIGGAFLTSKAFESFTTWLKNGFYANSDGGCLFVRIGFTLSRAKLYRLFYGFDAATKPYGLCFFHSDFHSEKRIFK